METKNIIISNEEIKQFCQKHNIIKLSLFGSVLRDDFRADSDVDVLVEFKPGHAPGFNFFAMQDELSNIVGRPVELHTLDFLSPYFRNNVLKEAKVQYATP
ncbi:MAG: nucleotidyltransferase family protein [Anaerolineales bacterium]|nr:nucleotidyltransferase family protein [Anaerolineales bacterium]